MTNCTHQVETPYEGWQRCTHPRVHTPGELVRAAGNCLDCPYRNREAPRRQLVALDDAAVREYFRWRRGERQTRPSNLYLGTAVVPPDNPLSLNFELLPCIHRGETTGTAECDTCALRGKRMPIAACELHGSCVPRRYTKSDMPETNCATCQDRREDE